MPVHSTPLRAPRRAVVAQNELRHDEQRDALRCRSARSGTRASTRCRMLSTRSCSPAEMKILVPVIAYVPSAFGTALVRRMPTSEPACGSVRHIVPVHSPDSSNVRKRCFCSGVPCRSSAFIALCDRSGYIVHAMFAIVIGSSTIRLMLCGRPWPPYARIAGHAGPAVRNVRPIRLFESGRRRHDAVLERDNPARRRRD